MNCCRKYLEYDPDYTRQLTPDNTAEDDDEERYYSDERTTEEDEDEDMDEEEARDEDNTDESLDPDDKDDLNSEDRRQLGMSPYDTEHSTENERAATPGVSKEVGKLSLDDDQLTEQETDDEDEVQIIEEVEYHSDHKKPRVIGNGRPTQRQK